jgi:hypothetical protein
MIRSCAGFKRLADRLLFRVEQGIHRLVIGVVRVGVGVGTEVTTRLDQSDRQVAFDSATLRAYERS